MKKTIAGKTRNEWLNEFALLKDIINYEEILWLNQDSKPLNKRQKNIAKKIKEADDRLEKFIPYIKKVFPEIKDGIIESSLIKVVKMKDSIEDYFQQNIKGDIYLKCDNNLPVAGSIKARGGIYEVLKHAEELALQHNLIRKTDNYAKLASKKFRDFFSNYQIAVGSTGNLGLSIGITGSKLGFKTTVHMSADAKDWKKELLRKKGVNVIEYKSDYSKAVVEGRRESARNDRSYFIDDENSLNLFMGYAVAAKRLKKQLDMMNIKVNKRNPLFVYLPCGVGGAPGGITLGLKNIYGESVHCFFVEPTHAPSMLLGLMTEKHNQISVQDFGIDNITEADGLAVGKPSGFIGKEFSNLINGVFTVNDKNLFVMLHLLTKYENIFMEPSAQAGFVGPLRLCQLNKGKEYINRNKIKNINHIIWGTGGSLVPQTEKEEYYLQSKVYI